MKLTMDNWERIANGVGYRSVKIYLNGELYKRCIEADNERGYIDYIDTNQVLKDEWPIHRIWGEVIIVFSESFKKVT